MTTVLFALFHYTAISVLVLLSYLFGRRLLLRFTFDSTWESAAFSITLGLGVISHLVFFCGVLGWLYTSFLWAVVLIGSLGCFRVWVAWPSKLSACWERLKAVKKSRITLTAFLVLAGLALAAPILMLPLYPPLASDATAYHLAGAKIYARVHHLTMHPYLHFPLFPQNNEMLFTLMLMFCDDIAAQLVQFLMMGLVAVALYAWGCRCFSSRIGLWAAALWLSNPLVLKFGSVAYIDIGLTLFVTLAAYSFFNWLYTKRPGWLALSGVFSGFAAGSKYSGLFFLGVFGIGALYVGVRERKWSYPVLFGWVGALASAPWYLYNAYHTGNPIFPFFGQVLGYGPWSPDDLQSLSSVFQRMGMGKTVKSFLLLPWNLTFNSTRFGSPTPVSPIYFYLLPILLPIGAMRHDIRGLMILPVAYTSFWFATAQDIRYLVPVIPLVSLATIVALDGFMLRLPFLRRHLNHAFISTIGLVLLIYPGWKYAVDTVKQQGPLPVFKEQRDAYLTKHMASYRAFKFLNELKGRDYCVYVLFDGAMAYFTDGIFMGAWWGPARLSRIGSKLNDGQAFYNDLRSLGAHYFMDTRHFFRFDLPEDQFFLSHFKPIYGGPYVTLFELLEKPVERKAGPELLQNPGFEDLDGQPSKGWELNVNSKVDTSSRYGHGGRVALRCDGYNNDFYQTVPVKQGAVYSLSFHVRAAEKDQYLHSQIKWSDEQGKLLSTDTEALSVTPVWKRYNVIEFAPPRAAFAIVYTFHYGRSSIWLDDFSFTEVKYE